MTKDKISSYNMLFTSFILYSSLSSITILNFILLTSPQSSIYTIILGSIIGLILINIYLSINDYQKDINILDKINKIFPKTKYIIYILLILTTTSIIMFYIYNYALFINHTLLSSAKLTTIIILILIISINIAKEKIDTLLRSSGILIYFYIGISLLIILGLSVYTNFLNILPITLNKNILTSSSYIVISIAPIFTLLLVPKNKIHNQNKYNHYFKITYLLSCIYILLNTLSVILTLGIPFSQILKYPIFNAFKKISLLNFIDKIEDILSLKILIETFIGTSIYIIYLNETIKKLFKIKTNKHLLILFITLLLLSILIPLENTLFILIASTIFILIHIIIYFYIKTNH